MLFGRQRRPRAGVAVNAAEGPLAAFSASLEALAERIAPCVAVVEADGKPPGGGEPDLGSGTVATPDGLVVTTAAVVAAAARLRVRLPGGRALPARRLGVDPASGVALLRVASGPLPFLPIRAGAVGPKLGGVAVVVGAGPTISCGIVSALGNVFRTDARAPLSSAGGPIVGARGELMGVATLTVSGRYGGIAGIPAGAVAEALAAIARRSRDRPSIGLKGWDQIVEESALERFGLLPGRGGVLVLELERGGAAARAGVLPLDVIVAAGREEERIGCLNDLLRALDRTAPGEEIRLTLLRGDSIVAAAVRVETDGCGEAIG